MALNSSNNYLETLVGAGADAQTNLYEAVFTFHSSSPNAKNQEALSTALTVRCKDFTAPDKSQESYPVKYLTVTIDRPRAKVNVVRNLSLTFRVDANYQVYKALLTQMGVTSNLAKGFVATNIKSMKDSKLFNLAINIIPKAITSETNETKELFSYKNCWITSINPLNFTYENSNPQEVKVNISYLEGADWASTGVINTP